MTGKCVVNWGECLEMRLGHFEMTEVSRDTGNVYFLFVIYLLAPHSWSIDFLWECIWGNGVVISLELCGEL